MRGLLRAFLDRDAAEPWHTAVVGAALLVGLLLVSMVPA